MSDFLKLNWADIGKGVLIAFGTAVIVGLQTSLSAGKLPTLQELGALALVGLSAGLVYIIKNVFTNSSNELGKSEPK